MSKLRDELLAALQRAENGPSVEVHFGPPPRASEALDEDAIRITPAFGKPVVVTIRIESEPEYFARKVRDEEARAFHPTEMMRVRAPKGSAR